MQTRLRAVAGVKSVSLVNFPPMGHTTSRFRRELDGREVLVYPNSVEPGFFETMNIPLLLGRTFYPNEKNAVIVSESFARLQWPGQNPVGKIVPDDDHKDMVVGVVGDARINAVSDDDATEEYWSAQPEDMPGMVVMVKTSGSPDKLPLVAQSISENLDPKLFPEIRHLKLLYHDNVKQVEDIATVASLIGFVAALVAVIGIIGVVAFTISQRTKEIAIRLALGAPAHQVLSSVLGQFSWPVLIGLAAGIGGTATLSHLLRRVLYGISNLDLVSYSAAIGVLLAIIAAAALLPARRALKLDIARALHQE
jgi:hypothetical protein